MTKKIISTMFWLFGFCIANIAIADTTSAVQEKPEAEQKAKDINPDEYFNSMDKMAEIQKRQHEEMMKDPKYAKYYNQISSEN